MRSTAHLLFASCLLSAQSEGVTEAIRERIERLSDKTPVVIAGAVISSTSALPEIYELREFRAAWSDAAKLDRLLALIRNSEGDGLLPGDYHLAEIERVRAEAASSSEAEKAADLDMLASDAYVLLLYHLFYGKADPVSLFPHWNFSRQELDRANAIRLISEAIESGALEPLVSRARPNHPYYENDRRLLAEYRALQAKGGWPRVPAGPALKRGDAGTRVSAIRKRLAATGDLPAGPDREDYDEALELAVKRFQKRHGLTADGAAGPGTLAAMNVSVEARIEEIRVNLERARWALHELRGEYVLVDVAGFDVTYVRDDRSVFAARAQVGKPYRSSPIFGSQIQYVVFNPTWTVPPTILRKDVLPKIARDPKYLAKNNMYRSGGTVVQRPGPNNALGRVKIMFPNQHLVYLHDTPSKSLFDKDARAFSSGCIRVENPLKLAELLLDDAKWDESAVKRVVESGKTTTVNLKRTIPVLILYWTVAFDETGQPVFRPDIYERNPPVLAALNGKVAAGTRPRTPRLE